MRWQPILVAFALAVVGAIAWSAYCHHCDTAKADQYYSSALHICPNCGATPPPTAAPATPLAHVPIYINVGGPNKTTLAFANVDPVTLNKFITYAQDQPATAVDNAGLFCTDVNPGCFSGAYTREINDNDYSNALLEGGTSCTGPKFDTAIFSAMAAGQGTLTTDNIIYHGNQNATAPPVANAASREKNLQSCTSQAPQNYNYQLDLGKTLLQQIVSQYIQGNIGLQGTWASFGTGGQAFTWSASTPAPKAAPTAIPGPLQTANPSGGACNYHVTVEGPWDCYYIYESDNTTPAYQSGQSLAFTNSLESDPSPSPRSVFYTATNTYPGEEADIKSFENGVVRASGDGVTRGAVHWQDNYAGVNFDKFHPSCDPNQMSSANAQIGELEDPIFDTKNGVMRNDTLFVALNCAIGIETARAGSQVLWYNHVTAGNAADQSACTDYADRAWHFAAFMLVWQPDQSAPGGSDDIIMADGTCTGANDPAIYPEFFLWPGNPLIGLNALSIVSVPAGGVNGSGCTNGGVTDPSVTSGITKFGAFQSNGFKLNGVAGNLCASPYSVGGTLLIREFNNCAFNYGSALGTTLFKCAIIFNATGVTFNGSCFTSGGCTIGTNPAITYDFSSMLRQSTYTKYCDFTTACLAGAQITVPASTSGNPSIVYGGNGSPNGAFCLNGGSVANFGNLPSTKCPAWGSTSILPAMVKTNTTAAINSGDTNVTVVSCAGMAAASAAGELVEVGGDPPTDPTEFVTVQSCQVGTPNVLSISGTFANSHANGVNVISAPTWILFGT